MTSRRLLPFLCAIVIAELATRAQAQVETPIPTPTGVASPAPLNHSLCYETHRQPLNLPNVTLWDAFGSSPVTVKRAKRLCAPADKNDEDPTAETDAGHLTAYTIKQTTHFTRLPGVTVTNQFGTFVVDLIKPDRLLVPTAKSLVSTPPPLGDPLDHFKCYRVKGRFHTSGIKADTQFGTLTVDIKKPLHLCAPANKNDEGIVDPATHLMCYQARGPLPQVPDPVFTTNQFGADSYPVFGARDFCAPSTATLPEISDTLQVFVKNKATGKVEVNQYIISIEAPGEAGDRPNPLVVTLPKGVNLAKAGYVKILEPGTSQDISDIITYDFVSNAIKMYSDPYDFARLIKNFKGPLLKTEREDPTMGVAGLTFGLSDAFNPGKPVYDTTLVATSY